MSLAADYIKTPTYIPPYRPMSRSKTTYGSMNEWMGMNHGSTPRTIPSHVPVTLSDANWREVKNIKQQNTEWMKMLHRVDLIPHLETHKNEQQPKPPGLIVDKRVPPAPPKVTFADSQQPLPPQFNPSEPEFHNPKVLTVPNKDTQLKQTNQRNVRFESVPGAKLPLVYPAAMPRKPAPCTPLRPFKDENRTDEYYRRYLQLSGNVAYRYPEPGYPRERQGAMGGTWRHVKEVLGYGGSQVCFVDGLVSLYDGDQKRQSSPSKQLPHMRTSMGTPAFAPNRHNVSSYGRTLQQELEKSTYKPWIDPTKQQMPKIQETPRSADKSGKYKGFYSYPGK